MPNRAPKPPRGTASPESTTTPPQRLLPFESIEEVFERAFRLLRPRSPLPAFSVGFRPYANLDSRIRAERGHRRIEVKISDQLRDAPAEIHEALAFVLLGKLYRKPIDQAIVERYRRFTRRPEVRRAALETRRRRGRKRMAPARGGFHDLEELFDELNRRWFEGGVKKPRLGWSERASRRLLGHYDPAHEAIVISRALDRPETPRFVVEYVLYHEMLHLKHPVVFGPNRRRVHSAEFRRDERLFPRLPEAEEFLRRL